MATRVADVAVLERRARWMMRCDDVVGVVPAFAVRALEPDRADEPNARVVVNDIALARADAMTSP